MGAYASKKNEAGAEKGYRLRETDLRLRISRQRLRNQENNKDLSSKTKSERAVSLKESVGDDKVNLSAKVVVETVRRELRTRGGSKDSDKSDVSSESLDQISGKRSSSQTRLHLNGLYPKAKNRRTSSDSSQENIDFTLENHESSKMSEPEKTMKGLNKERPHTRSRTGSTDAPLKSEVVLGDISVEEPSKAESVGRKVKGVRLRNRRQANTAMKEVGNTRNSRGHLSRSGQDIETKSPTTLHNVEREGPEVLTPDDRLAPLEEEKSLRVSAPDISVRPTLPQDNTLDLMQSEMGKSETTPSSNCYVGLHRVKLSESLQVSGEEGAMAQNRPITDVSNSSQCTSGISGRPPLRRVRRPPDEKCDNSSLSYISVGDKCSSNILNNNIEKQSEQSLPTSQLPQQSSSVQNPVNVPLEAHSKTARHSKCKDSPLKELESAVGFEPVEGKTLGKLASAKDVYEFEEEEEENSSSPASLRVGKLGLGSGRWGRNGTSECRASPQCESPPHPLIGYTPSSPPTTFVTPEKSTARCGVKLKLRMKRSPVLDEVIEVGSHLSDSGVPYEPEYEVLTVEGITSQDYQTDSNHHHHHHHHHRRHRKKHHREHRRRSDISEGDSTDGDSTASPRPTMKRLRLILGNETHTITIPGTHLDHK